MLNRMLLTFRMATDPRVCVHAHSISNAANCHRVHKLERKLSTLCGVFVATLLATGCRKHAQCSNDCSKHMDAHSCVTFDTRHTLARWRGA